MRSHVVRKIDIKSLYKYDSYISLNTVLYLISISDINIIVRVLITAIFYLRTYIYIIF